MQLAKFENGIECHTNKIAKSINDKGFYVQHEGSYSYTVGLNVESLPEIVIKNNQGFSKSKIEEVVKVLSRCTSLAEMHLELRSVDLECAPIKELEKRRCFYSARLYYGNWEFYAVGVRLGGESE